MCEDDTYHIFFSSIAGTIWMAPLTKFANGRAELWLCCWLFSGQAANQRTRSVADDVHSGLRLKTSDFNGINGFGMVHDALRGDAGLGGT